MRFHSARGASAASLEYGERLLREDPLQEEVHRAVMEEYLRTGERSLALRQYRACRRVLKEELGLSPGVETEHLYYRVLRTPTLAGPERAPDESDDSLGVTEALRLLADELDDTRARLRQICELVDNLRHNTRARAATREAAVTTSPTVRAVHRAR
jgi:DNA-binding SARP family transcriptional activator